MSYIPNPTDGTEPVDTVDMSTAAAEFRALKTYIQQTIMTQLTAGAGLLVPVGGILQFGGLAIPSGFVQLPGAPSVVSRTTYATLFAAIGTAWGAGDGSTTFGLPWLAGGGTAIQPPVASDVGGTTLGQMPAHTHPTIGVNNMNGVSLGAGSMTSAASNTGSAGSGTANLAAGAYFTWIMRII